MFPTSLKARVSLSLSAVLVTVMVLFVFLIAQQARSDQLNTLVAQMTQLSQVIARSTRYAMLLDEPDIVDKIIQDIGKQQGIQRVRVVRKSGVIAHSNHPEEIGQNIDKEAEHCSNCHTAEKVLSARTLWRVSSSSVRR